jgi:hypothetical protein
LAQNSKVFNVYCQNCYFLTLIKLIRF